MLANPDDLPDLGWPAAGRHHIGAGEVAKVETETRTFRALDYRYGGGWCRDAVSAQLSWGYRLLDADSNETVRAQLCVALADLTSLAGWTAFDSGKPEQAHARFDRALALATRGRNPALASNVLYRKGRVFLHYDAVPEALEVFERGEAEAEAGGSWLMRCVLCANEAWAHAKLGDRANALASLGRASDAFERADIEEVPGWVQFFDENDLRAMTGTVYHELALRGGTGAAEPGIAALTSVVRAYGDGMARSRSFCLAMLATCHLLEGDVDEANTVTQAALSLAASLNSTRFVDRLRPLRVAAARHPGDRRAEELTERITGFALAA